MKTPEELAALAKPTCHLNGTNGKTLFKEYKTAMHAVQNAMEALTEVTVHGRDYYVQEAGSLYGPLAKAQEEMRTRYAALEGVHEELIAIAANIMEQVGVDNLID